MTLALANFGVNPGHFESKCVCVSISLEEIFRGTAHTSSRSVCVSFSLEVIFRGKEHGSKSLLTVQKERNIFFKNEDLQHKSRTEAGGEVGVCEMYCLHIMCVCLFLERFFVWGGGPQHTSS